jgi:hypothetical protein
MIKSERAAEIVQELLDEDDYGIYEVVWALNSAFPQESVSEKYRVANQVLLEMLKTGRARLFYVNGYSTGSSSKKEVPSSEAESVLNSPTSWYPEHDSRTVVISGV